MRAARFTPPLLAAVTLVLLGANALPSIQRKRRLRQERSRLVRELAQEEVRALRLQAEVDALQHDPFYIERLFGETWCVHPEGAIPFEPGKRAREGE